MMLLIDAIVVLAMIYSVIIIIEYFKKSIGELVNEKVTKVRGFEQVKPDHIKIKIPTQLPKRGTKHSACYDFYSKEDVKIEPGDRYNFVTDVKAYMQEDEVLLIYLRSSQGMKLKLQLTNIVGVIDSDYYSNPTNDGNISIELKNEGNLHCYIKIGDRIGQAMFTKFLITDDDNLDEKAERVSGIGSTGK